MNKSLNHKRISGPKPEQFQKFSYTLQRRLRWTSIATSKPSSCTSLRSAVSTPSGILDSKKNPKTVRRQKDKLNVVPYGTGYSDYSRRLNSCLHAVHALHLQLLVCIPCGIEHGDNSLDLPLVTVHREHVAIVAARSSGCFGRTAGDRRRDCHAFLSAQHRGELLFHR